MNRHGARSTEQTPVDIEPAAHIATHLRSLHLPAESLRITTTKARKPKTFDMKKIVLCAVALVAASAVSAQTGEITSNRGENWLSQDGDWGLTFEATPLLNYAGNLFNGTNSNGGAALNNLFSTAGATGLATASHPGGNSVVIGGKKLVNANTAYRAKVRIGFGSDKATDLVADLAEGAADGAQVSDVETRSFMGIDLGFGIEKRVGSTRIVGVYGAEFGVGFGSSKVVNEWGNPITETNAEIRPTETKNGSTMAVGLNAFVGVEWFVAPKVSLSGEYMWGLALRSTGHGENSTEEWDPAANDGDGAISTETIEGGTKLNQFSLDTGVSGARIGVNFYFQ